MTRRKFIEQVEGCQQALRRFLTALCCGDTALADDLAQDTFLKAFLSLESLKDTDRFTAWIFRIAYNAFISNRRTFRHTEALSEADGLTASDDAESQFHYQDLHLALGKLSDKERSVILLHYMQGYSLNEVAEITESSIDAVKQRISRGRLHLKNLI